MRRFLLILLALAVAVPVVAANSRGNTPAAAAPTGSTIIVKFRTGAAESAIAALNNSHATMQVDAIPAAGLRVLRIPASRAGDTVLQAYKRNPLVEFAEENTLVRPGAVPSDANYANAWHLATIRAAQAWDGPKAPGVLVGVCDTGFEATHPDLQPILMAGLGYNTVSNSNDWSPIATHGTMVAGAVAAATNNGIGVAGVAWGANIIPVRISDTTDGTAYVSDAAECITYSADHGARVINLSYRMAHSASIDSAAAYARSRGAVVLVAAGNDNVNPAWPSHPNFLAVAATDSGDARASFSNFGAYIDIAAPGVNIWTTRINGTYGVASGTSFASPVAAGVVALMFGANPALTPAQAESILRSTAADLGAPGRDDIFGDGRVDAAAAVQAALGGTPPPPPADTAPPSTAITAPAAGATVSGTVTVSANASDNVGVTRVEFLVDGVVRSTDTTSPYGFAWDTTTATNGAHSLVARAFDAAGNSGNSASLGVTVSNAAPDTTAPSVAIADPAAAASLAGTVNVNANASDNVGVTRVEFYVDGVLKATDTTAPYGFAWDTRTVANGSHGLSAKVFDAAGNVGASTPIVVDVQNAPTPISETFTGSVGGKNRPASITHTVTTSAAGQFGGTLSWGGKGKLDVKVYDAANNLVATSTATTGNSRSFTFQAAPGTYRVVVSVISGNAGYTLLASHY